MTIRVLMHIIRRGVAAMQGYWVRSLREHLELSQKELAKLAKVSPKAVDLLEHDQPLPSDDRHKIITQLYAKKASKFACASGHCRKSG